jgi:hypothetical protein
VQGAVCSAHVRPGHEGGSVPYNTEIQIEWTSTSTSPLPLWSPQGQIQVLRHIASGYTLIQTNKQRENTRQKLCVINRLTKIKFRMSKYSQVSSDRASRLYKTCTDLMIINQCVCFSLGGNKTNFINVDFREINSTPTLCAI